MFDLDDFVDFLEYSVGPSFTISSTAYEFFRGISEVLGVVRTGVTVSPCLLLGEDVLLLGISEGCFPTALFSK